MRFLCFCLIYIVSFSIQADQQVTQLIKAQSLEELKMADESQLKQLKNHKFCEGERREGVFPTHCFLLADALLVRPASLKRAKRLLTLANRLCAGTISKITNLETIDALLALGGADDRCREALKFRKEDLIYIKAGMA